MNCKQGDMAIIVRNSFEENIGALVLVVKAAEPYEEEDGFFWECISSGRALSFSWEGEDVRCGVDICIDIPDSDLLPIRPGDLHETEDYRKEVTA